MPNYPVTVPPPADPGYGGGPAPRRPRDQPLPDSEPQGPGCDCAHYTYEVGHPCYSQCAGGKQNQCPPDKPYYLYGQCTANPNGIECDEGGPLTDISRNCPAGREGVWCDMSTGTWKCDASVKGGARAGGGGGGGASAVNYSQFLNPNWNLAMAYGTRTPQELEALGNVSALARLLSGQGKGLYDVGMPAYTTALNYWNAIVGGSPAAATAAIAPEAQQMSQVYGGARRGIEAGSLRGGARETALTQLGQQGAGAIANLIPAKREAAAGNLAAAGLGGAQLGAGIEGTAGQLYGAVNQAEAQNRQFAISAEQANRFGGASLLLQNKGLDIQKALGFASLDLQKQLGFAGLSLQRDALAQAGNQFAQSFGLQQQYFGLAQQAQRDQRQQAEGAKWGALLGAGLQGAAGVGSALIAQPGGATMVFLPFLLPLLMGRLG